MLDKETGRPIAGAIVVAQWILATPPEGDEKDYWIVSETLTDAAGKYHIPGWGPKMRPWFRWFMHDDPTLLVFKPGYWLMADDNRQMNPRGAKVRKTYWNGKDINLVPFRLGEEIEWKEIYGPPTSPDEKTKKILTSEEKWAEQLHWVQSHVNWLTGMSAWSEKDWMRIKEVVKAINQECLKLPPQLRTQELHGIPDKYRALVLGDAKPCL